MDRHIRKQHSRFQNETHHSRWRASRSQNEADSSKWRTSRLLQVHSSRGSLDRMVLESLCLAFPVGYAPPPSPRQPRRLHRVKAIQDDAEFFSGVAGGGYSSPASDLAARRGVFSRKHYGSVEMLTSIDGENRSSGGGRFRVETGELETDDISSPMHSPLHLENPEFQTRWYFKYFLGKLHQNYVGCDVNKEPYVLSVVVTDANNHSVPQYRAILWRKTGNQKICLPYNPSKPLTVKGILGHFDLEKGDKGPKEIFSPEIQKDLLVLEEQEGSVNFKFGVLYAKDGQLADDEMYGNEFSSTSFEQFYHLLGEKIRLKNWDRYRAGLDTKSDTTGLDSIYTVYEGHEIMFHVSTLLPYTPDNKQQVERKRHVGNDIVNIVFMESDSNKQPVFKPSMMKTHFTHIYALVTYNKEEDSFRLQVYSEESVPLFGPPLPCPPVFRDHHEFRDFLLVKLINGEKAAFNTPVFAQKRERTLDMLIRTLYQDYTGDNGRNLMLSRRAFSDIKPELVHGSRRKEEARQLEFLRIGQSLKVKTILRGDAPTSLATRGALLKHQPWEPQCYMHDFNLKVLAGDSWGDKLIVHTARGTYLLQEGGSARLLLDRSVAIKQLSVAEAQGLLIFSTDKAKESRVYVFRLSDFEGEEGDTVLNKLDIKDHKLERTKGCHLYCVSRPGTNHLRLLVAVGRRLLVHTWKHSSAWSAWCPAPDNDVVDGFQFLRELQSHEVPQTMTLIDGLKSDNQVCVSYKNQFDVINEKNGDTLQLYQVDAKPVNLVAALDIYEDDEPELLLCYNHISHFQKIKEESSLEFDFHWNSEPKAIVCAFPYIMAFTCDAIEIRLIINGSLVHSMTLPDLNLVTSKCDIYFTTSAADCGSVCNTCKADPNHASSGPSSPKDTICAEDRVSVYKIPLMCLSGQASLTPANHTQDNKTASLHTPPIAMLTTPLVSPVIDRSQVGSLAARRSSPRRSHSRPSAQMKGGATDGMNDTPAVIFPPVCSTSERNDSSSSFEGTIFTLTDSDTPSPEQASPSREGQDVMHNYDVTENEHGEGLDTNVDTKFCKSMGVINICKLTSAEDTVFSTDVRCGDDVTKYDDASKNCDVTNKDGVYTISDRSKRCEMSKTVK